MGNYTEFELTVDLKYDESLFRILSFMADSDIPTIDIQTPMFGNPNAIDHRTEKDRTSIQDLDLSAPLFSTDRWSWMFYSQCEGHYPTVERDGDVIHLDVSCYVKNYTGEIEKFLDYIAPYVISNGKVGTICPDDPGYIWDIRFENGQYDYYSDDV